MSKTKRLRVDLYPPVSTKLKTEAKKEGRSPSNMAARIIDKALPPPATETGNSFASTLHLDAPIAKLQID